MQRLSTLVTGMLAAMVFAGALGAVEVGDDAPDFTFEKSWNTPEGYVALKDYRGSVALIDVWATW
jgi:hypothetical protein